MFFVIPEFERAAKIRKIVIYCFLYLFWFQSYKGLKKSSSDQKVMKQLSKSIKFVTSCAGHVDEMKT